MRQNKFQSITCAWIGIFFLAISLWVSCTDVRTAEDSELMDTPVVVSTDGTNAEGPYFTTDHEGFPVLVWSEKLEGGDTTGYVVKFSRLSKMGDQIVNTREVTTSKGCSTSSECMAKVAFKKDGTIVSVYARRKPTPENRFAGAIYYTQSFDNGKNWSEENYLHVGDTTHGIGRSFFDIATLPDGEIGAIWLDSRFSKSRTDGSTMFFAKTQGQDGFLTDQAVGQGTCECCRTDLFVDRNGDIHALYRDIWQDSIRDISHIISSDNGETFSQPVRISHDDWVIYGCPHTGPSVSQFNDKLYFVWFTMGGEDGLYHLQLDLRKGDYSDKELLTVSGSHPQVVTSSDGEMVYLWEEGQGGGNHSGHMGHGAPATSISIDSFSLPESIIKAQVWENHAPVREHWVSLPGHFSRLPVAVPLVDGFIGIAWVRQDDVDSQVVVYRRIRS